MSADSHTALPSDLPNFVPEASVSSGVVRVHRGPLGAVDRSTPAVRLPHWSLPPVCSVQPCAR